MLDQIALGSLLEWVAQVDPSHAPRVWNLLEDDEIFVRYLETAPVRQRLPSLWEAHPDFEARLESMEAKLGPGLAENVVLRLLAQHHTARRGKRVKKADAGGG